MWVWLLQVKPQQIENVLSALAPHVTQDHLIISIAAGIRCMHTHTSDSRHILTLMLHCLDKSLRRW